jgi:pyruvate dehydrogenase E2 component (dihydrolipoamide acetyltransferase)
MAISITVPRLGWSMEEGLFAGWLKKDGEPVRAGDLLFRLESDKATEDIESFDSGILRIPPNGPREGEKVRVGAVIGYLAQPGEPDPHKEDAAAGPAARRLGRELGVDLRQVPGSGPSGQVTPDDVRQHQGACHHNLSEDSGPLQTAGVNPAARRPAISPRAKRVAGELGIDWTRLVGSGKTGRIRERDVRAARQQAQAQVVETSSTRRIIAERMLRSVRSTAPVTLTAQADATNLVNLREQFKAVARAEKAPVPSYTDFLVKLAAVALQQHPQFNAHWDGDNLVVEAAIHIGIATDTDTGLLVPVVRDVAGLGLRQLAASARDLIERARQRKLTAGEMQGGTFTITNLGAFGIDGFTPIINYPQVAILGVGRIQRRPVVVENQIIARAMVTLSLTFDHCGADGGPAARFLQALCNIIENPGPSLMS